VSVCICVCVIVGVCAGVCVRSSQRPAKRRRAEELPESAVITCMFQMIGGGSSRIRPCHELAIAQVADGTAPQAVDTMASLGAYGKHKSNVERDFHRWTHGLHDSHLEYYELLLDLTPPGTTGHQSLGMSLPPYTQYIRFISASAHPYQMNLLRMLAWLETYVPGLVVVMRANVWIILTHSQTMSHDKTLNCFMSCKINSHVNYPKST
jgi:hypothetical protein